MNEIMFLIEDDPEGGYSAQALGYSIFTEGETVEDIKENIADAVKCHFDESSDMPKPEESIGLKPNFRYLINIEDEEPISERDIWDVLSESSGKIDGPEDWSEEHDHYLYGTKKQHPIRKYSSSR